MNNRPNVQKFTSMSYDLVMKATVDPDVNNWAFQAYIAWQPWANQTNNITNLELQNNITQTARILGTLADEADRWKSLYAKTKLSKVIVKYMPSVTQGMTGVSNGTLDSYTTQDIFSLCASNAMYTIPIYDNVDDIINNTLTVTKNVSYQGTTNVLTKPYVKSHSIYKPWTRVIKPKAFIKTPLYTGDDSLYKKNMYIDAANGNTLLNGLFITMPPLTGGGFIPAGQTDLTIPKVGDLIKLGRLQFTYYQKFRTRT